MSDPIWCFNCKRWLESLEHECAFRFCACEGDKKCNFHKRGGYTTKEDEVPSSEH